MRIYVEAPTYTGKIVVFSYIFTRVYIFFGKINDPPFEIRLTAFRAVGVSPIYYEKKGSKPFRALPRLCVRVYVSLYCNSGWQACTGGGGGVSRLTFSSTRLYFDNFWSHEHTRIFFRYFAFSLSNVYNARVFRGTCYYRATCALRSVAVNPVGLT